MEVWEQLDKIEEIKKASEKASEKAKEKLTDFGTGATRCSDADEERFDLISPFFLQRLSKIMAQGATTHGEDNWRLGIPISVTLNHLERHLNMWKREILSGEPVYGDNDGNNNTGDNNNMGDPQRRNNMIETEDHLAKVAFGIMAICHYQAVGPLQWGSFTDKDRLKDYLGFNDKTPQI